jgi:UDP:flavonoid glycosyltransferase YjiC (YdhE family)
VNVLLLTLGSHGDVHPFVGLALELVRRGHSATVATNGHFEPLVRQVGGIDFRPIGSDEEYHKLKSNKDLWSPSRSFKVVFAAVAETLRKSYEIVADFVTRHHNPVVVASSLGLAARVARDRFDFPLATVHLQPGVIRSLTDPSKLPGLFMPRWFPMWLKRGIWEGGDKYVVDPVVAVPINGLRKELGLPPVKRVMKDWWHSPDRVIGMFPEWYAPTPSDWPAQYRAAGFPLWDEQGVTPMASELESFLRAGPPPVAFTPGSAMVHGHEFFDAAAGACARLGRRGLLLTRHPEQLPERLPPGVMHVSYAPFTELLPRCAALVHHGGIGTSAQGLRAGIPQLLQPMAHDQFDNARRLGRLGVGMALGVRRFTGKNVARALAALLDEATYAGKARALARERFAGAGGLSVAADEVERLARPRAGPITFTPVEKLTPAGAA